MAKISFYGGVGTVTGSKYLIENNGKKVLVDCGLFQGLRELRERNWEPLPFEPKDLDAVVITHAHIDHTGFLPRIVKLGFDGPVYASRGTNDLIKILLPDSARLQEEEADYRNRKGLTKHKPALPLYDENDAKAALALVKAVPNDGNPIEICEGINAAFNVAGHILGASLVLLTLDDAADDGSPIRFLFSGDLGHYDQPILKDPAPPPACEYLMVESTYGDRLHDEVPSSDHLARVINEGYERNGPILIPAFSVGRTQEILYLIRELEDEGRIPIMPVAVDSPMAKQATQVYNRWREEHDEEYASVLARQQHPLKTRSMTVTGNRNESIALNDDTGARIIISASGMLSGGRVLHHAVRILPDPNATIVFVGYQAAGTRGRQVLDGKSEVKIMHSMVPVRCHVEVIGGFSAHADWKGVIRWLRGLQSEPRMVFTTHGEPESAEAMAGHIKEEYGWNVMVPEYGQTVDLN
ncbi:MAG: MBL fold metallo-hydrolase [Acidobacteria bacterium]|mgnify:CR=1 FL=1|nr:MAG: MBL fold metallo-hydrolase [Acidobacteriota bacterium]REK02150.1 MAG: MBL fold metallo-hydrolase [Acidobacteriota bacterium]REK14048.1 MAG: MBL fold metallo-hydrolase [Acidobacteriota bacterium]REK42043.1 MAG: MBL fold metallo-hydrolase [Acidobacteriota bacterium]